MSDIDLTFPLGGFVNHSVQLFWRGCLTLKFSASWKTVMFSVLEVAGGAFSLLGESMAESPFKPVGGCVGIATSAMLNDVMKF